MELNRKIILALALLIGMAFIFTSVVSSSAFVSVNSITYHVEVADTDATRSRGLMERTSLCERCGMLFVFDSEDDRSFWMKDTLIPLDMIFVNEDFRISEIHTAVPCEADPCSTYSGNAKYVLEVNSDESEKNGFGVGDEVRITFK